MSSEPVGVVQLREKGHQTHTQHTWLGGLRGVQAHALSTCISSLYVLFNLILCFRKTGRDKWSVCKIKQVHKKSLALKASYYKAVTPNILNCAKFLGHLVGPKILLTVSQTASSLAFSAPPVY